MDVDWAQHAPCAVTVSDAEGRIIYMNEVSHRVNDKYERHDSSPLGHNLREYHNPRAMEVINRLLAEGGTNVYAIERQGHRKQVYQAAWKQDDGAIGGLVEITFDLPDDMPLYQRK